MSRKVLAAHADYADVQLSAFERGMGDMFSTMRARILARLQKELDIDGSGVKRTPANQRVLRRVDQIVRAEAERAGFADLADRFASSLDGQIPFFDEILAEIGLAGKAKATAADAAFFESYKLSVSDGIQTALEIAADRAKASLMLQIGGLPFKSLVETFENLFATTAPAARTLAATHQATFFRTVADRGFRKIEEDHSGVTYYFDGPNDKLSRPWCKAMLEKAGGASNALPRKRMVALMKREARRLKYKLLGDPMLTCGGYNCRHQVLIGKVNS